MEEKTLFKSLGGPGSRGLSSGYATAGCTIIKDGNGKLVTKREEVIKVGRTLATLTSGVARGGGTGAMAPPKLLVNVFFCNEFMLLRSLNGDHAKCTGWHRPGAPPPNKNPGYAVDSDHKGNIGSDLELPNYEHEKVNVIEITAMDVIRGLKVVKREINRLGQKRSEIRSMVNVL